MEQILIIIAAIAAIVGIASAVRLLVGMIKEDQYFNDFAWQIVMIVGMFTFVCILLLKESIPM